MAKLKIYQSQLAVKETKLPDVGALALPFNIAYEQGEAFKSFFKDVSNIRKSRKATQNQNDARDIILEVEKDFTRKFSSYLKSSNEDDYNAFLQDTNIKNYNPLLKKHNKEVRSLVSDYIFNEQKNRGPKLHAKILKNHVDKTLLGHDEDLNRMTFKAASPDRVTSEMGFREIESWFDNNLNAEKYQPEEFKNKKKETLIKAERNYWLFNAKTNPDYTIRNYKLIEEAIGTKEAERALEIAKQKIVSDADFVFKKEKFDERFNQDKKIGTFTELLLRIKNDEDPEYLGKVPTLDLVNDLWKADKINSAQYDALLKFYNNPEDYGNEEVLSIINSQIFIAESVEDLDRVHRTLNLTPEYLMELGIKDVTTMNAVIDKAKDRQVFQDMKYYKDVLNDMLGKLDGGIFVGLPGTTTATSDKKLRTKADRLYNEYIEDGFSPEESFMKVSKGYLLQQDRMPTIYDVSQISSIQTLVPAGDQKRENPKETFNNWRKEVALKYKDNTINIDEMKRDLDSLDVMEDLFKIRQAYQQIDENFDPWGASNATTSAKTGL